jgi:hypothetical protein
MDLNVPVERACWGMSAALVSDFMRLHARKGLCWGRSNHDHLKH